MIPTYSSRYPIVFAVLFLTAASVLAAALPANTRVQAGAREPIEAQRLGARTDLVRLDVSVLDKHGNFAGGLAKSAFRVLDDGVEQPVMFFAPVESPARVLVMIETSPAVYLIHDEHLSAAYALVQGLDPADQVALVTYSDLPREALGFTTNKQALLNALNTLQYTIGMGTLNFYDSLAAVVDNLGPANGKSAVVLLSTGIDSSPASHWEPLVRELRGTDVVIFPVALGGALRDDASAGVKGKKHAKKRELLDAPGPDSLGQLTGFARADRALKLLAQISGGRAYFPQSDAEFAPIYREIASTLRHQYVLGIAPAHDGHFHRLTVEVLPDGASRSNKKPKKSPYRIFVREGYLAPSS